MTANPLVSVIIPTYNNSAYLKLAVQSALAQDYENKEIIVIDDGSDDDTEEVLTEFGSRISVIAQKNAGVASARNAGMKMAKGSLICFLDSDDYWLPGKLAKQVAYLNSHSGVGAVYCAWEEWRPGPDGNFHLPETAEEPLFDGIDQSLSGYLYNQLLLECIILTSTFMIRRSLREQVGWFDARLRRGQDYDYWLRTSRLTKIHKLRECLALYRIHVDSITHAPHRENYPCIVIEKALSEWGLTGPDGTKTSRSSVKKALARNWFDFGYLHLHKGDPTLASEAFRRCIRLRPLSFKAWLNMARSLAKMATKANET